MSGSARLRLIPSPPSDIISDFMELTDGDETPDLFRRWSAICLVAGALERRVWTRVGSKGGLPRWTYPNLYVWLVGPPGVGKSIIGDIRDMWFQAIEPGTNKPAFKVAPNNMTKASLIDRLSKSTQSWLSLSGPPIEYNSLLVAAEEFGVFLPSYDMEFIGVLNDIYNNPELFSEERRHGPVREVSIPHPQLNILGGVQPAWLAQVFPEHAWATGFSSRTIMVYASSKPKVDLYGNGEDRSTSRQKIISNLSGLRHLYGYLPWNPDTYSKLNSWNMANGPPTPTHSRLEDYNTRRTQHVSKIATISSISRTNTITTIEDIDLERAITWLTEAEKFMPDAFRAMKGKSDIVIINDLYDYITELYRRNKQKPVPDNAIYDYLANYVPSDKVKQLIEIAERSNYIVRMAGTDTYRPAARHERFVVE